MLTLAALVWLAMHFGIAGTRLRDVVARTVGEGTFRGAFSVLSIVVLIWLVRSYNAAGTVSLWYPPSWLLVLLAPAMLPACVLLVGSVTTRKPTMIGREGAAGDPEGIQRITRHPMLWSFAIWAAVHMIANGDTASLAFFGTFLITALGGMPSIDAKLAHRDPAAWSTLATHTAIVPFAAIAEGRNRFVWTEVGWWRPVLGLILWGLLLFLHPIVIGASPLPR